jgi:hypothetical protein
MRDRKSLKGKFKKGSMPDQNAFHDLIDSAVNKIDDDFSIAKKKHTEPVPKKEKEDSEWIESKGRVGKYSRENTVPADGDWHTITPTLNYCQAFEIVARTGVKNTGKHAILHAIAVSAFGNSHSAIRTSRSSFRITRSWFDFFRPVKLQLRWAGTTHKYRLQMRCKQDLGHGVQIKFFITQLWSDEKMGIKSQFLDVDNSETH